MSTRRTKRAALLETLGIEFARLQEASNTFDDAAAAALVIERADLAILTALLFRGALTRADLAAGLEASPAALRPRLARLAHGGYVRRVPGTDAIELTALAREWIETIWGPLQHEGTRALEALPTVHLQALQRVLEMAHHTQVRHARRVRALTEAPRSRSQRQGGLSPAALRRVEIFVEANLEHAIRLADLAARAGVSRFHFAHAFKATTAITPRAFVEARRIERAKQLLRTTTTALSSIALATGFGTQSRFTTVFRRATGMTPAAFRRFGA